jgi:hypothetical protein
MKILMQPSEGKDSDRSAGAFLERLDNGIDIMSGLCG